jgi:hypothetical protein
MKPQRAAMRNLTIPRRKLPADQQLNENGHPWYTALFTLGPDFTLDVNSKLRPNSAIGGVALEVYATLKEWNYLKGKINGPGYSGLPHYRNTHGVRKVLNRIIERARWRNTDRRRFNGITHKRDLALTAQAAAHGDFILCPSCRAYGCADKEGTEVSFDNSVWFNPAEDQWECRECWAK